MISKADIEREVKALLKKHEATFYGTPVGGEIYSITTSKVQFWISFDDENMMHLCAGNAPCSLYDEFEQIFKDMGYEIIDADGSRILIESISNQQHHMITDKCKGRIIGITKTNGDKHNGRVDKITPAGNIIFFDNNKKRNLILKPESIKEVRGVQPVFLNKPEIRASCGALFVVGGGTTVQMNSGSDEQCYISSMWQSCQKQKDAIPKIINPVIIL